jgi:hypothetical protein
MDGGQVQPGRVAVFRPPGFLGVLQPTGDVQAAANTRCCALEPVPHRRLPVDRRRTQLQRPSGHRADKDAVRIRGPSPPPLCQPPPPPLRLFVPPALITRCRQRTGANVLSRITVFCSLATVCRLTAIWDLTALSQRPVASPMLRGLLELSRPSLLPVWWQLHAEFHGSVAHHLL